MLHLLIKMCRTYWLKGNKSELHLNAAHPQDTLEPAANLATGKSRGREPPRVHQPQLTKKWATLNEVGLIVRCSQDHVESDETSNIKD